MRSRAPSGSVQRHHRTGRQIPCQDSRRRQSILGSDPPGEAATILTVDTAGSGHRVELLGLWKVSRRSRGGRLDVQGPLLTGPSHTTLVDATEVTGRSAGPGRRDGLSGSSFPTRDPAASGPVSYTAVLPVAAETVLLRVAAACRRPLEPGTRGRGWTLGCYRQAVLVRAGSSTAPSSPKTTPSAARRPTGTCTRHRRPGCRRAGLHGALLATRTAGHAHVTVDGVLIRTDRVRVLGPTVRADRPDRRVDLWGSGKHAAHGGNIQVLAAPDGWPIWTSGVRPGREHDTTVLRTDPEVLPLLGEWTDQAHAVLADLGYEGERAALTTPIKKTSDGAADRRSAHRELAARGHPWPGRTRQLAAQDHFQGAAPGQPLSLAHRRDHAAVLVLLHHVHGRTT